VERDCACGFEKLEGKSWRSQADRLQIAIVGAGFVLFPYKIGSLLYASPRGRSCFKTIRSFILVSGVLKQLPTPKLSPRKPTFSYANSVKVTLLLKWQGC